MTNNWGKGRNTGNVKTFFDIKIPADTMGNSIESGADTYEGSDNLGNSLDEEPAHLKSGILSTLTQQPLNPKPKNIKPVVSPEVPNYALKLKKDFNKLLSLKQGLPFVFTLKKFQGAKNEEIKQKLTDIESLIKDLLYDHEAQIQMGRYKNNESLIIIFYIRPTSQDPSFNKNLIASLRKVLEPHIQKVLGPDINVFLVLHSAQEVMEQHLSKLGAIKI